MKNTNNNQMIIKALSLKVYNYSEGKAIFLNDEKVFLNDEISSFLDDLDEVDAEWEMTRKGIEIEIDDETKIFETVERFENYDGRDHRIVECDFESMKKFVQDNK